MTKQNNKFNMLGTIIDMDNHRWDVEVMDKLDNARDRGAYNDLSMMAYALLSELVFASAVAKKLKSKTGA